MPTTRLGRNLKIASASTLLASDTRGKAFACDASVNADTATI
jgi:hypothetical protein